MVKIIKEGPGWTFPFTCKSCKSELEAEEADLRIGEFGSMGDYDRLPYINCPVCRSSHRLDWAKVPASWNTKNERMKWIVIRTDDNGNKFLVDNGLPFWEANARIEKHGKGHKQLFETFSYESDAEYKLLMENHKIKV